MMVNERSMMKKGKDGRLEKRRWNSNCDARDDESRLWDKSDGKSIFFLVSSKCRLVSSKRHHSSFVSIILFLSKRSLAVVVDVEKNQPIEPSVGNRQIVLSRDLDEMVMRETNRSPCAVSWFLFLMAVLVTSISSSGGVTTAIASLSKEASNIKWF